MPDVFFIKIQNVGLNLKMDALMFMHHRGQFFDMDNIGTKVLITTNKITFLDVQYYVSTVRPRGTRSMCPQKNRVPRNRLS